MSSFGFLVLEQNMTFVKLNTIPKRKIQPYSMLGTWVLPPLISSWIAFTIYNLFIYIAPSTTPPLQTVHGRIPLQGPRPRIQNLEALDGKTPGPSRRFGFQGFWR